MVYIFPFTAQKVTLPLNTGTNTFWQLHGLTGAGQITEPHNSLLSFFFSSLLSALSCSLSLSHCLDFVIFFSCKECVACLLSYKMLALWVWVSLGLLGSGAGDTKAGASGGVGGRVYSFPSALTEVL